MLAENVRDWPVLANPAASAPHVLQPMLAAAVHRGIQPLTDAALEDDHQLVAAPAVHEVGQLNVKFIIQC
jgi:hypothetical protein